MKTRRSAPLHPLAFTLMELLVVVAIIGILAALLFPAGAAIKKQATIKKARVELQKLVLAINAYKTKFGYYPPDHPLNPAGIDLLQNSLYFELSGVTNDAASSSYQTLDGAARIPTANVQAAFGQGSILNCAKGGDDNGQPAVPFIRDLKPGQYTTNATIRLLTCSVAWPSAERGELIPGIGNANPWRYMLTGATNTPGQYDLWVDLILSGKTYRIGNWSETPEIFP